MLIKIINYSFAPAKDTAPTNSTKSLLSVSYQFNYLVIKLAGYQWYNLFRRSSAKADSHLAQLSN